MSRTPGCVAVPCACAGSMLMMRERAREELCGDVHDRNDALVRHAGGTDDADGADDVAVDFVRRRDHAAFVERHETGLAADEYLDPVGAARDVEELQQPGFALEEVEEAAQAL